MGRRRLHSLVCRFKPLTTASVYVYIQSQAASVYIYIYNHRRLVSTYVYIQSQAALGMTLIGGGVRDVPTGGERADARQARVYLAGGGGKIELRSTLRLYYI